MLWSAVGQGTERPHLLHFLLHLPHDSLPPSMTRSMAEIVSADPPSGQLERDEYFEERKLLIEARQQAYLRADQMVIGGATGALLLSITFLEKIVTRPPVARPALLATAWVALLFCLAMRLFSQFATGRSFDCEIERLNARVHELPEPTNRWASINRAFAVASAAVLVVGIALLARFAYLNAPFK